MTGSRPDRLRSGPIARHVHPRPYATVVLAGRYEEAGDLGRFRVGPGDVLFHRAFSAHRDIIDQGSATVLDLPLAAGARVLARGRVADPDALVALAERDPRAAGERLADEVVPVSDRECDPADTLGTLLADSDIAIGAWSMAQGHVRETLSRQFRQLYGIDAARYRGEARARRAWRLIVGTTMPLAEIAAASGHSDQPHMTRAVRSLTGYPPGAWRRVTSLQYREPMPR